MVLVGAGHAHLQVIANAERLRAAGVDLSVVDPGDFRYSGLATGVLSGAVARDDNRVELAGLCLRHGVNHVAERAVGLAHRKRCLWLASGQTLTYDALSFNVGSLVDQRPFDTVGAEASIWPVKPLRVLADLYKALCADMARDRHGVVAVIGGGPSGCEVAANVAALVAGSRLRVMLVTRADRLWRDAPRGAARRLARELALRGVDIVLNTTITGSTGRCIYTSDGRRFAADHVVLATGPCAPAVVHATSLPASAGGLEVASTLHSPADSRVFAVGDCADFRPRTLPCHGVHAVRQAPVLMHNLIAAVGHRRCLHYRPGRNRLLILDLGDGTGLARRGRLWWHGRLSLRWKRRLDFGFMARLREPPG